MQVKKTGFSERFKPGWGGDPKPSAEPKKATDNDGFPNAQHLVEKALHDIFRTRKTAPFKRYTLRGSNLPYCPLFHLYHNGNQIPEMENYSQMFYTAIGHGIHEALQFLGPISKAGGDVFGDWKCDHCGHTIHLESRPSYRRCPVCNKGQLKYNEIELEHNGFSIHIDFVFQFKDHPNFFAIVDFKTSSISYMPRIKEMKQPHRLQTESYVWMLNKALTKKYPKRKFTFTNTVAYFARDKATDAPLDISGWGKVPVKNPPKLFTNKITAERMQEIDERMSAWVEQYNKALSIEKKYSSKALDGLIAVRPCKSDADYENIMGEYFQFKEPCPCRESCVKDGKATKQMLADLWKKG